MPVSALTPFRGRPLREPSLGGIRASGLSLIKAMPLKQPRLDYRPDREQLMRSFKGLEFINDKPVADRKALDMGPAGVGNSDR
jgi:hypothetical protein